MCIYFTHGSQVPKEKTVWWGWESWSLAEHESKHIEGIRYLSYRALR
jgi:hypothetical protein